MARTPPGETRGKVYRFVRQRLLEGEPPTLREIQAALGFRSVESARTHLEALVGEGKLERRAGKARGLQLPARSVVAPPALVPLLGQVQAGDLTAAIEEREGVLPVQVRGSGAASNDLFALRVRGESMIGAGILPGDLVIVRRQETAESGDLVVALVEDEATVKRLRVHSTADGHRAVLEPANPEFSPIEVPVADLVILGKVLEVRRYLGPLPLLEIELDG